MTVDQLLERRRLGQTDLGVRQGHVGITSSTKEHNLGLFDYAHLRVPLPKDLKGSAVFVPMDGVKYPESYFLMVSATRHALRSGFLTPLK